MADSANTTVMHGWLDRMNNGDLAARDELLRAFCDRLERLARKMLKGYRRVRVVTETDSSIDLSTSSSMRDSVVLPAPDGDDSTSINPRRAILAAGLSCGASLMSTAAASDAISM